MIPYRKQAGADFSIRRDTNPATLSAEWIRDWRNEADFPDTVNEAIAPGSFAARVRHFNQRHELRHPLEDFVEHNHGCRQPYPVFLQRHEFDKADDHRFLACKLSKRNDLVFVEATH